jgi:predicted permease
MTDDLDLSNSDNTFSVDVPGYKAQDGEHMSFEWEHVTPGYFSTLRIPLIAGRTFTDADGPNNAPIVVVNESFVRKFFGTPDQAIGKTFSTGKQDPKLLIVGVVKDAKHRNVREPLAPIFYSPWSQSKDQGSVGVYVRTRQAPEAAASNVRIAVNNIDSKLVVDSLQSMQEQIDGTLTSERMLAFLASGFGAVAIFVTAIGLYGVLAYSIAQRTREIGIRMALGATRALVVNMVFREVLVLAGLSIAVALPLSIALSSLVKSQLFGISDRDPLTLIAVTLAIGAIAIVSACIPARRAAQVQPMKALRYE